MDKLPLNPARSAAAKRNISLTGPIIMVDRKAGNLVLLALSAGFLCLRSTLLRESRWTMPVKS